MTTLAQETTRTILGVPGRAFAVIQWAGNGNAKAPREIANQKWISERRKVDSDYWGPGRFIQVEIRHDDSCKNGHPSFGITGHIERPGARDWDAGGCIHEEIARYFPELKPLIEWHLCSTDGPMHYIANTLYHMKETDSHGLRAGQPGGWKYALTFGDNPILHKMKPAFLKFLQDDESGYDFEVIQLDHAKESGGYQYSPKFTFGGYGSKWHDGPFDSELDAKAFLHALQNCNLKFTQYATIYGEGKERDLDAARNAGVWPDATDAELLAPDLESKLKARLPGLLAAMRDAIENDCGMIWNLETFEGESK